MFWIRRKQQIYKYKDFRLEIKDLRNKQSTKFGNKKDSEEKWKMKNEKFRYTNFWLKINNIKIRNFH